MQIADAPPAPPPALSPEERRHLEDAYRQAIGTVRALARALGKPCPIVSREERRGALSDAVPPVAPP